MKLELVKNEEKYWKFIRTLRNDPKVKKGFIQQREISNQEHKDFMKDNGSSYFVCIVDSQPAGFVGVINNDIRVAVDPKYQTLGIGKYMINELMYKFPKAHAKIKINNIASARLFESCGFKIKYYILEKDRDT